MLEVTRVITQEDKEILEKIAKAIPNMTEREKGYVLGMAEAIIEQKEVGHEFP